MTPILPAALAQEGDTYELEDDGEEGEPRLRLRIADAFERPARCRSTRAGRSRGCGRRRVCAPKQGERR